MKILLILFLLLAAPAEAQGVTVKTGEHGAFTRIVLTYPAAVDWVLGRSDGGYALRIAGAARPYDLSGVYRVITRDRLRSIWVDPVTNDLQLGIDCACHAIPFELSARVLVIDIKDGPPPQGSSFELGLVSGAPLPPLQSGQPLRPRKSARRDGGYDWLGTVSASPEPRAEPAGQGPAALETALRLDDFRAMLIDEMGRGATQGVVELDLPPRPVAPEPPPEASPPSQPENARAALESLPGIGVRSDGTAPPDVMVQGGTCPRPADLGEKVWTGTEDAAAELALARAAVLSEFDVPDTANLLRAVDTYLHFGLGAEARQLLASFLPPGQSDPLRRGISYLVEGETPPDNPFRNMQSCDSAVALWALLAAGEGERAFVNGAAVSRSFLALPPMLRAFLGPETAQRLLTAGDSANAEVVRQSFERAAAADDPAVGLLAATQALQKGDPVAAEAALPAEAGGEAALSRLLALVEARFQQRKAVDGTDLLALEAFAFEHGQGPLRQKLDRALAHANALGGNFAAAFQHAGETPALAHDVWMLLAETGTDSALLGTAVGLDPARRTSLSGPVRSKIAERLLAAGLPNAAADWATADDTEADLAARIALANGDARRALRLLAGNMPGADPALLAASYTAAGDLASAASTYQGAGDAAAAARVQRWAGTWQQSLAADAPPDDPWAAVAGLVDPPAEAEAAPPLRAGLARLEESAGTRQAIANLLAATPAP
ncbi:hypothetical protein [Pseudotabrizicola algicola]|uniref:HEAT repeat domain-containing protein n=1 Tax=Pseudotabrizicola algicola TaxID=2709381 RepID=A0A6B3RJH5_9RHOB|nr:hypothetical protein [Pseudotabrizicola algicola]NEX46187.1 hypothetical protein [Pseudotabrizicola algicola]